MRIQQNSPYLFFLLVALLGSYHAQTVQPRRALGMEIQDDNTYFVTPPVKPRPEPTPPPKAIGIRSNEMKLYRIDAPGKYTYTGNRESKEEVIRVLGTPTERTLYPKDPELGDITHESLTYPGVWMDFYEGTPWSELVQIKGEGAEKYAFGETFKLQVGGKMDPSLLDKYEYATGSDSTGTWYSFSLVTTAPPHAF